MPKGSREQTAHRRDEILDACSELYEHEAFRDITVTQIAERTSLSRPAVYNYFQTIGEIFLGLLQREYEAWMRDMEQLIRQKDRIGADEFPAAFARTLEPRGTMLRIESMDLYEIEDSSRLERLTEFKRTFCRALETLDRCLRTFCPGMTQEELETFRCLFLPFLSGVYPSIAPTEKQQKAMDAAGIVHPPTDIGSLTEQFLRKFLPNTKDNG